MNKKYLYIIIPIFLSACEGKIIPFDFLQQQTPEQIAAYEQRKQQLETQIEQQEQENILTAEAAEILSKYTNALRRMNDLGERQKVSVVDFERYVQDKDRADIVLENLDKAKQNNDNVAMAYWLREAKKHLVIIEGWPLRYEGS